MSKLRIKDANGYVVLPDTIPTVDASNLLYGASSTGNKTYTATEDCIVFVRGAGQPTTPTTITRDGASNTISYQIAQMSVQLKKGDSIKIIGYANWSNHMYAYGLKYLQ